MDNTLLSILENIPMTNIHIHNAHITVHSYSKYQIMLLRTFIAVSKPNSNSNNFKIMT